MLEMFIGFPRVLARLVRKLSNRRRPSLPLYTSIPDLPSLSIGVRLSSVPSRTRLTGGVGVSGAGANDLDGAWEMVVAGGVLLLVRWLRLLWRLMVKLRSELVVVIGGVDVRWMGCVHVVGDIDQSDCPTVFAATAEIKGCAFDSVETTCSSVPAVRPAMTTTFHVPISGFVWWPENERLERNVRHFFLRVAGMFSPQTLFSAWNNRRSNLRTSAPAKNKETTLWLTGSHRACQTFSY